MIVQTSKNPAAYLLNKIAEMVYTKEELLQSKGVKGLERHKMEALKGEQFNLNFDRNYCILYFIILYSFIIHTL